MMLLPLNVAIAEDALQVVPFSTNAGITLDDEECFSMVMTNTHEYTAMEFHLYLPKGMRLDMDYPFDMNPDRFPGVTKRGVFYPNHDYDITNPSEGHYYIKLYNTKLETIGGTDGELLSFYYETDKDMQPGYYLIKVSGAILGVDSHTGIYPETSASWVKIGEPSKNEVLDLGDYDIPSFVQSELPDQNVIINGTCSNLVLTDGEPFVIQNSFTATNVTYSRSMANQWGTIVLPYDVASNDDVAYYVPSGVEDDVLKLTQMDVLPANTPALVEKKNGDSMTATAQNVTVVSDIQDGVNGNITMHGSYTNDTKVTDQNAYYIKNNKFWLNNEYFFIDAFRAYFTVAGAPQAKSLTISHDDASIIDALTGNGDVSISEYYDASGARNNNLRKGINIVRLCNGETKKIIVE